MVIEIGNRGRIIVDAGSARSGAERSGAPNDHYRSKSADLDRHRSYRHAQSHAGFGMLVREDLGPDAFAGDVLVSRGRAGTLIKALWLDGITDKRK